MPPKSIRSGVVGVASVFILLIFFNCFTIIEAGTRGVVLRFGQMNRVVGEGLHMVIPIAESVVKLDVKIQKLEVDAISYSKDIQTVTTRIALNYHLVPEETGELFRSIGVSYVSRVIDPAIQESVKAATARFTAQNLIEQRAALKLEILEELRTRLQGRHIIVDEFSITNFDFSDEYERAVEAKQVAQQRALEQENVTHQVEEQKKQTILRAEAEAEAIRIQVHAIREQGGAAYVELKKIEKWNGVLPVNFYGSGPVPFINISPNR